MKILAFGIVKEIFSRPVIEVDGSGGLTIDELKVLLEQKYPPLNQLGSYMIAVNNKYASDDHPIHEGDEVAVIPPVSGG